MTRDDFIKKLSNPTGLYNNSKIAVCQHYLDNYPVNIRGMETALRVTINGGSNEAIDFAFNSLVGRIKQF
jgi:hypothetical protein